jgi:L-rhamnose mutarotase
LQEACKHGHFDIVKYLIQSGADNIDDCLYSVCCDYENVGQWREIMSLLNSHGCNNYDECLNAICLDGSYDKLEYLMELHTFTIDDLNEALKICRRRDYNGTCYKAMVLLLQKGANQYDIFSDQQTQALLNLGCHQINNKYSSNYVTYRNTKIASFMSLFDDWRWPNWDHNIIDKLIAEYYAKY